MRYFVFSVLLFGTISQAQTIETFEEYVRGSFFSNAEFGFIRADKYARAKAIESLKEWKAFILDKAHKTKGVSISISCDPLHDATEGRQGAQYESRCDITITHNGSLKSYISETYGAAYPKGPITTLGYDFVENAYAPYYNEVVLCPQAKYGSARYWRLMVGKRTKLFSYPNNELTQTAFKHENRYVFFVPHGYEVIEETHVIACSAAPSEVAALRSCTKSAYNQIYGLKLNNPDLKLLRTVAIQYKKVPSTSHQFEAHITFARRIKKP